MGEGKKEKNFLLLNMSTLHDNSPEVYYESKENFRFRGVSQMEADTKYFLRKLQNKKDAKLDKIFIVASPEARTRSICWNNFSVYLQDGWQKYVIKNSETDNNSKTAEDETTKAKPVVTMLSAVEFYKFRICAYILGLNNNADFSKSKDCKADLARKASEYEIDANKSKPLNLEYSKDDLHNLFITIPKEIFEEGQTKKENETDIYENALSLCEKILKEKNDSDVNLYVDMQGSRRYDTFILNAAIKLLEIRGITVTQSVAIDYNFNNNINGRFNNIVDTTINDRIFEMVSGMNEFIKTGRGDTLAEFRIHAQRDENHQYRFKAEKEITDAIIKISNSISLCSIQGFDEGLAAFNIAAEKYSNQIPDSEKFPMFQICLNALKKDYEDHHLLNGSSSKAVDQICWCLDKQLYQQALTLIEAKIPDSIVKEHILYYGDEENLTELVRILKENSAIVLPDYLLSEDQKIKQGHEEYIYIRYAVYFKKNDKNFFSVSVPLKFRNLNYPDDMDEINTETRNFWLENSRKIANLLEFYHSLRTLRNTINHAIGEKEIDEGIQTAAEQFCEGRIKGETVSKKLDFLIRRFLDDYREIQATGGEITGIDLSKQFPLARLKKYEDMKETLNNKFLDAFVDAKILYYGDNNQLDLLIKRLQENGCLNTLKKEYLGQTDNRGNKTIKKGKEKAAWITQIVTFNEKSGSFFLNGYRKVCEKSNIEDETYKEKSLEVHKLLECYLDLVNKKFSKTPIDLSNNLVEQYNKFENLFNKMKENGTGIDLSKYFPLKN